MSIQVICINDKGRPEGFPQSKWIKKNEIYTVVEVANMMIQGCQGLILAEIDMTGCDPYRYFAAWRFAPLQGQSEEVEEN